MASIIKNQLLKHLSRYAKNLSADKININTLNGEGEVSNLLLDEKELTDLLELPCWLKLTAASCNHVSIKITWKVRSVPIILSLDCVELTLETCEIEQIAKKAVNGEFLTQNSLGKYSFIHKIVDGITVIINTVSVKFTSPTFSCNFELSRIRVESVNPKWQKSELQYTRLKNAEIGQILVFKEVTWQNLRIEASSNQSKKMISPLRLLTNKGICRITIKKRLSDCSVVSSRLVVIFDSLLWVLTDSQLKAAIYFTDSLSELVREATKLSHKIKVQKKFNTSTNVRVPNNKPQQHKSDVQKYFDAVDVQETSYHTYIKRIDLHICDDPGDGRSYYSTLQDGGALHILIQNLQLDFYPYHLLSSNRKYWPKYDEASLLPYKWLKQSLKVFEKSIVTLNDFCTRDSNEKKSSDDINQNTFLKELVMNHMSKLMTTSLVLRVGNLTIYRVTTSKKKEMPKPFVIDNQDSDLLNWRSGSATIHLEFTYFYNLVESNLPLPAPKTYVHINPLKIYFDLDSCLWFNTLVLKFSTNKMLQIYDRIGSPDKDHGTTTVGMDVKVEAVRPLIIIEENGKENKNKKTELHFHVATVSLSNGQDTANTSRADLTKALAEYSSHEFLRTTSGFPTQKQDLSLNIDRFKSHASGSDILTSNFMIHPKGISKEILCISEEEPQDLWAIKFDSIFAEFLETTTSETAKNHYKFFDPFSISSWIHKKSESFTNVDMKYATENDTNVADILMFFSITDAITAQINHHQLLFLIEVLDVFSELSIFLALDDTSSISSLRNIIFGSIPRIDFSLLLQQNPKNNDSRVGPTKPINFLENLQMMSSVYIEPNRSSASSSPEFSVSKSFSAVSNVDVSKQLMENIPSTSKPVKKNTRIKEFSAVKRGFKDFFASMDISLNASGDDETLSINSDSSDTEIVFVEDEKMIDYMFSYEFDELQHPKEEVDEANEAFDDKESNLSLNSFQQELEYKIITFRLHAIEIIREKQSTTSAVKIAVASLNCEEDTGLHYTDYKDMLNAKKSTSFPSILLRLEDQFKFPTNIENVQEIQQNISNWFKKDLQVKVKDCDLKLSKAGLTELTSLGGESNGTAPTPISIKVKLESILLTLLSDFSEANSKELTSLNIEKLFIKGDVNGKFQIQSSDIFEPADEQIHKMKNKLTRNIDHEVIQQLIAENQKLKKEIEKLKKT